MRWVDDGLRMHLLLIYHLLVIKLRLNLSFVALFCSVVLIHFDRCWVKFDFQICFLE